MEMDDPGFALPKDGKVRPSVDRAESLKVQKRSGGRCEVVVWDGHTWSGQCRRRATQVHHMIGGRGKRGVGLSALSEHKQHVCDTCHLHITGDIGGRKLIRVGGAVPVWTDTYRRTA